MTKAERTFSIQTRQEGGGQIESCQQTSAVVMAVAIATHRGAIRKTVVGGVVPVAGFKKDTGLEKSRCADEAPTNAKQSVYTVDVYM